MRRDAVDDAADRLAHVLGGRDDQTARQQQHRREDVVQPKYGVVRLHLLRLEIFLESAEQLIHDDGLVTTTRWDSNNFDQIYLKFLREFD